MKAKAVLNSALVVIALLILPCRAQEEKAPPTMMIKVHGIVTDDMVIQRDKPIKVWGWAKPGDTVTVRLGGKSAEAEARLEERKTKEAELPRRSLSDSRRFLSRFMGPEIDIDLLTHG